MNQGLHATQAQQTKLAMTPQLQQSIHILKLSGDELREFLQEQALDNPVLEVEERVAYDGGRRNAMQAGKDWDPFMHVKAPEQSLEESLVEQLRLSLLPSDIRRIACYLAGNLNESGYLTIDPGHACRVIGLSPDQGEEALRALQALDPPGIGARNLAECLLAQIMRDEEAPIGAAEMAKRYLPLLAQGKVKEIAERLKLSLEGTRATIAYLKTLDPRPGLAYGRIAQGHYIVPEAIVRPAEDGLAVVMTAYCSPRVSVNARYADWMNELGGADGAYLKEKVKAASWIQRSVEQRKVTLGLVIRSIAEEQHEFMLLGPGGLKPLGLRAIAEKLGLHESTVSRAIQGKYLQTPHGVYDLKYFFSVGLPTSSGGTTSNSNVKFRIKQLVGEEDKSRPYSDQQLADRLGKEGIAISRRTVTKYREELGFLSSTSRKR